MGNPVWPLFDLRLRTPALELRVPTDDELVALCHLARAGIHDPAGMPFTIPWTDQPSPAFERSFMQHHWGVRAGWSAERWTLALASFHDGEPIGMQDLGADNFSVLREVRSGSWLGQRFQGRGFGKQQRAAVLELAFTGLGAVVARSGAVADNHSSLAVSRALGYQDNGTSRTAPRGEPVAHIHLLLTPERWRTHRHCEVEIEGLDACRDMFGA